MNNNLFIPIIFSVIVSTSVMGFVNLSPMVYYAILLILLTYMVVFSKTNIGLNGMWIFITICFFSILLNIINPIFKSWTRFGLFLLVTSLVGPVFDFVKFRYFKIVVLDIVLKILVCLSIGSFFCYFVGINYMMHGSLNDLSQAGTFGGLTSHSMILGPISGIGCCYLLVYLFENKDNLRTVKKTFIYFCFMFCFGSVLLSASRTAFISTIIANLFILWNYNRFSIKRFIKQIFVTLIVLSITLPISLPLASGLIKKQELNIDAGGAFTSREEKWNARINEFYSSPIIGIGFASINPDFGDEVGEGGVIEPGSSWGAVLSMTGILGFISFIFVLAYLIKKLIFYSTEKYLSTLLASMLIFFLFHMVTEGYVLAGGSFLFFLFWISMGASDAYLKIIKSHYKNHIYRHA